MKKVITIFIVLSFYCSFVCAKELVDGLRVWSGDDKTRAVLDISGPVKYKVFNLSNPSRVVIDITNVNLGKRFKPSANKGLLKSVRTGVRNGRDLRVVFDTASSVKVKSFLLPPHEPYGNRLVIDLNASGAVTSTKVVKTIEQYQPDKERDIIIAIDAGHGGEDPGAIGPSGLYEKRATLAIAKKLAKSLNQYQGIQAKLIRNGDYYVSLSKRREKARQMKADLFVSIHADGFYDKKVHGSSIYVLSEKGASSEAARWIAKNENASDLVGGVDLNNKDGLLRSVLLDLSQSSTLNMSSQIADELLGTLKKIGKVHKNYVERANFSVLRSPDIPSILIETAFISNPTEEKRLKDISYQKRLASSLAKGIYQYYSNRPLPDTLLASRNSKRIHTVSRGDTLSGIASQYQVNLASLRAMNKIKNKDRLLTGMVLTIP